MIFICSWQTCSSRTDILYNSEFLILATTFSPTAGHFIQLTEAAIGNFRIISGGSTYLLSVLSGSFKHVCYQNSTLVNIWINLYQQLLYPFERRFCRRANISVLFIASIVDAFIHIGFIDNVNILTGNGTFDRRKLRISLRVGLRHLALMLADQIHNKWVWPLLIS